ncbi:prevent-host-death protein [Candidatus Peregrinibacteria bacterium]|nr:prevent-host-death protein [Candidatus Peregrinibacteria bacterium]
MNNILTANDLKTRGISAIEKHADSDMEIFITVRGEEKYVILSIEKFNFLREAELTAALIESKKDVKNKRYHSSIKNHLKKVIHG